MSKESIPKSVVKRFTITILKIDCKLWDFFSKKRMMESTEIPDKKRIPKKDPEFREAPDT
jgi:hypothetical protein